ncbi:MAG: CapA family protein [Clostridia bacterium]|nr:CapA family protein [Clostridia bacterium]
MKRMVWWALALWLMAAAALGEGWIVDESLDEDSLIPQFSADGTPVISDPRVLNLSFVGDCSIGGVPSARGREGTYTVVVDEKGYDWPFSLVRKYLEEDDFSFANNEVVFTESTRFQEKNTVLGALPRYAQVYLHSGIDALNTVNNHCLDYFESGYQDTLNTLDGLNIRHFGTLYPDTRREQEQLGVYEIKGVTLGAVGFSYPQMGDLPAIAARIARLKERGCDLVIVSLHWGREVSTTPKNWQVTLAQRIIDAGADVIWGHHPHILQQVQFYKGKPIFYSTGNFTFGAMQNVDPDTGIFQLRYRLQADGPRLTRFAVVPCRTQGRGDYRPYELTDPEERKKMLGKLIYPRKVDGMQNLPPDFVETGMIVLEDGYIP